MRGVDNQKTTINLGVFAKWMQQIKQYVTLLCSVKRALIMILKSRELQNGCNTVSSSRIRAG